MKSRDHPFGPDPDSMRVSLLTLTVKVVILAGGRGTRISEETFAKPKPMIHIGPKPILWHIMKYYATYGHKEFIVCLGYRGYQIKEYFYNYRLHNAECVRLTGESKYELFGATDIDDWNIILLETGLETETGGRIAQALNHVGEEAFFITYGDVLASVDLGMLEDCHRKSGLIATVTAGFPPAKYGAIGASGLETPGIQHSLVDSFTEKPTTQMGLVSAGYFITDKRIGNYIKGANVAFEGRPLEELATSGHLGVFKHSGFWQPMDTLRDKMELESLWLDETNQAPWCIWGDT